MHGAVCHQLGSHARCENATSLLHSLRTGHRVHSAPGLGEFVPAGCAPEWMPPGEACSALSRFRAVYFVGDSLTRHTYQAMHMLLRGDMRFGALPVGLESSVYDNCRCDGQFSEDNICRLDTLPAIMSYTDIRAAALCPAAQPFALSYTAVSEFSPPVCRWAAADPTRVFVYLAGGAHFHSDPVRTVDAFLRPAVERLKEAARKCPQVEVTVAWGSTGVQTRALDGPYPHQSREAAKVFNSYLAAEATKLSVPLFDYWELTNEAATSDGFHHLSDVNLLRALYILNFLELVGK